MRTLTTVLGAIALVGIALGLVAAAATAILHFAAILDSGDLSMRLAAPLYLLVVSVSLLMIAGGLHPPSESRQREGSLQSHDVGGVEARPYCILIWIIAGAAVGEMAAFAVAGSHQAPDSAMLGYVVVGMLMGQVVGAVAFMLCRHSEYNRSLLLICSDVPASLVASAIFLFTVVKYLLDAGLADVLAQ